MNHARMLRIIKPIWLIILALGPVAVVLLPTPTSPILGAVLSTSYVLWLGKLAYDNSDRFYFHFTRLLLRLANARVRWTMSVELDAKSGAAKIDELYKRVLASNPTAAPWHNEPGDKMFKLPDGGGLVRLRDALIPTGPDGEMSSQIVLEVSDLVVPFNHSDQTLDWLLGLLEELRKLAEPTSEKYVLKIRFDGKNPYYGLFVRQLRLPKQELVSFECDFVEHVGLRRGRVQATNERIALTTDSINTLNSLSRRYLTLASLDLTNP